MSRSNRNAYALVGLAVAMIALQGAAAYGIVAGANALSRSEPVSAILRSASVVASSLASTVVKNGANQVARLGGRSVCEPAPSVAVVRVPNIASVVSPGASAGCCLIDASGNVQWVDLESIAKTIESGACESRCVIVKKVARETVRDVAREVSQRVAKVKTII